MPVDMSKYPDNWQQIRNEILKRAGGTDPDPRVGASCEWCKAVNWQPHPITKSKVVLTIAHLADPDPMNCDPGNLAALCQKCHNSYDAPMRAANRAEKKRAKQMAAGQLMLIKET